MASYHHPHPHPPPCCCSCSHTALSPPSPDPLVHALASQLLLSQSQHHLHLHNTSPPPPHLHPNLNPKPTLLHSLLRRVSALESSLPSPKPSPPPPPPPQISTSLKHSAARVIQRHFRLFLVRRSQALRALRRLASIRSRIISLTSSLDSRRPLDPKSLCREASDLLLLLDSIQNGDSLVCDDKRSISVELAGIVEVLERIPTAIRRQVVEEQHENVEGSSRTSSSTAGEAVEGNVEIHSNGGKGNSLFGLYAPLPVKMEPRRCD